MQVIATQQFPYANKTRRAGDTFEMSDEDARLMIGFGKVKAVAIAPAAEEQKSRRSYRRRDMVAEGTLEV